MTTHALTTASPRSDLAVPGWLDRSLYAFGSHWHGSDGHRLHYVDEGEGRPILFVHGTPSWSFEWRRTIATLRSDHRCIAPDHLGFGLSDKPPEASYGPADHARRLRELVQALDLRDLILVVHDFGGPIGLPIALEEPDRVAALVVINTWMWPHGHRPAVARMSRLVASPLGRFLYQWLNASPRWIVPASFADRSKLTRQVHRHYLAPFRTRRDRTAPWVLGCELAGSDPYYRELWERRARLTSIATTVVWGTRDPAFGQPYLETWREVVPHARVIELPVGHFPQEEEPDEVTAAVRASASAPRIA